MEFLVWDTVPLGNACLLDPIRQAAPERKLLRGISYDGRFPSEARFEMSKRHKKETALLDDVMNMDSVKVCSRRLVEFLKTRELRGVEYLPVTIFDHKGKVASSEYAIVHPVGPQPALDVEGCQPTYSNMIEGQIVRVQQLVIEPERVEAGLRLFRLDGFFYPVLVDRDLAMEIESAGFRGPAFTPLDQYEL